MKTLKNTAIIVLTIAGILGMINLFIMKVQRIDDTDLRFFVNNWTYFLIPIFCFLLAGMINENNK
ncbi:hypothetical protein [Flavobacterium phage FPSV-S1]|nr:hypothetical protein [Flavobacterium phage FPSV-S1]QCW20507.1 hypothetical protein [Flavobacterium phage FPSV-S8]